MPFVPFTKKSAGNDDATASAAPDFSKKFAKSRKRKTGRVAPAQKALMNPGGRAMGADEDLACRDQRRDQTDPGAGQEPAAGA